MRIATWNINGVKARQGVLLKWLETHNPDIGGWIYVPSFE